MKQNFSFKTKAAPRSIGQPLYIWGIGQGGRKALDVMTADKGPVAGFIDSNPAFDGTEFLGKPVLSPGRIQGEDEIFIVIGSAYFREISRTLQAMGFLPLQHFVTLDQYLSEYHPDHAYGHQVYIRKALDILNHMQGIKAPRIMNIGSGSFFGMELALLMRGAGHVTSIDLPTIPGFPDISSARGCYENFINALLQDETFMASAPDSLPACLLAEIFTVEETAVQFNPERFQYLSCSAESVPLEDGSLDVIFSQAVFEHLRHPPRVIDEIHRLLKPGGLSFHNIDLRDHRDFQKPYHFLYASRASWQDAHAPFDFTCGNPHRSCEYQKWFQDRGFAIEEYSVQNPPEEDRGHEEIDMEKIHPDFARFSREELLPTSCFLKVRKK